MSFVAGEIVIWILVAAFFGFVVGWLARGRGSTPVRRRTKKRRLPR